ncbi:MAG: hypothetical protein J0L58_02460 [Burkholderiales bacterium]|nr:hypothetical protein [Burkholderiales bacterium]
MKAKLLTWMATALLASAVSAAPPAPGCTEAPHGEAPLYLRGGMNNWAADDDFEFAWQCNAYLLNTELQGRLAFKIADPEWSPQRTFGNPQGGNFELLFEGEQTLALRFDASGKPLLELGPRRFAGLQRSAVTDPAALGLRFDSRRLQHKQPFGARPAGSSIQFSVGASAPGVKAVFLVLERRHLLGNQEVLRYHPLERQAMAPTAPGMWTGRHHFKDAGIYGYWFEVHTEQGVYALQNNRDSVYWTREKGSMGAAVVEPLPRDASRVRRFRQTIHLPQLQVPEWSADVVYYYIFPERFRNGDRRNDPDPRRQRYQDQGIERHTRWIADPHKPGLSGDGLYNNDFFGGDLAGIIEKLDEIKALGANTLYLTPIFQAASNHKYDAGDFHRIDPAFGRNADYERLTREAAKRGLRVIPDTSLNHVGSDSPYFDRFGNFGGLKASKPGAFAGGKPNPASPYFDWFLFDTRQAKPDDQYQGWVGVKDLPELNKNSPSWRTFAYRDRDSVTRRWLRAGSSGWRMDVAPWVPDDFWREWRAAVKEEKPDALTLAETWFDASKFLLGDQFDGTMNYIFRNAVLDYAAGGSARQIYPNLELLREAYPLPALLASMNLLSTHDAPRALHRFGIEHNPHTHPGVDAKQLQEAKQRLLLALLFQVGFPGAPTVYYGDEVGVGGGDDPFNRATYPWADQGGKPDLQLRERFRQLLALRNQHEVLRRGSLSAPLLLSDALIGFERVYERRRALVLLNNQRETLPAELAVSGRWRDALSGERFEAQGDRLALAVPGLFGRILLAE